MFWLSDTSHLSVDILNDVMLACAITIPILSPAHVQSEIPSLHTVRKDADDAESLGIGLFTPSASDSDKLMSDASCPMARSIGSFHRSGPLLAALSAGSGLECAKNPLEVTRNPERSQVVIAYPPP